MILFLLLIQFSKLISLINSSYNDFSIVEIDKPEIINDADPNGSGLLGVVYKRLRYIKSKEFVKNYKAFYQFGCVEQCIASTFMTPKPAKMKMISEEEIAITFPYLNFIEKNYLKIYFECINSCKDK